MAALGTHPYARLLPLVLVLLLALGFGAAPAFADHETGSWTEEQEAWDEQDAWDEEDDWNPAAGQAEESFPAPAPAPEDEALPELPEELELPAEPWTPPSRPAPPATPTLPMPKGKTVKGSRAYVRADGKAAVPRGAPKRVRAAIAAANRIIGKPYVWGGGHARLFDRGYDCSGAVGFSLIHATLQRAPMVSGQYASSWGRGGKGRWITVYANRGHVYMEIAGLRLDTSPVGDPSGRRGTRWRPVIGQRRGFKAKHPAGL